MKSPVRYLSDSEFSQLPLHERALHVARSQVGVTEASRNWSPIISLYLRAVGLFSPAPWCAAFVTWCLIRAGADRKKLPRNAASCRAWCLWARERGINRPLNVRPKRGDVIAYYDQRGRGHIMFAAEIALRLNVGPDHRSFYTVRTLEGNTNAAGSREGVAVMSRQREFPDVMNLPNVTVIDGELLSKVIA
jgi:hypothetical protein